MLEKQEKDFQEQRRGSQDEDGQGNPSEGGFRASKALGFGV